MSGPFCKDYLVGAEQNKQLMLYAAGAACRYHNCGADTLTLHIVQPHRQMRRLGTCDIEGKLFEPKDANK